MSQQVQTQINQNQIPQNPMVQVIKNEEQKESIQQDLNQNKNQK